MFHYANSKHRHGYHRRFTIIWFIAENMNDYFLILWFNDKTYVLSSKRIFNKINTLKNITLKKVFQNKVDKSCYIEILKYKLHLFSKIQEKISYRHISLKKKSMCIKFSCVVNVSAQNYKMKISSAAIGLSHLWLCDKKNHIINKLVWSRRILCSHKIAIQSY